MVKTLSNLCYDCRNKIEFNGSMNTQRNIDLVDDLLANSAELNWLEFKKDNIDGEIIGKLCSALSNGARIVGRDFGYLLWGIDDSTRKIVGTTFDPEAEKHGNQPFSYWLAQHLKPCPAFVFKIIHHPKGRVVMLEIPATTSTPVAFDNISYTRIGSSTPKLTDYPEHYKKLIECLRPYTWEHGIAKQYVSTDEVLNLLDYTSYFRLTKQTLPTQRNGILDKLEADRLIAQDVGGEWNITNLGAILFATDLNQFDTTLARKAIRLVMYKGKNKASQVTHRLDEQRGYATGFENLIDYINNVLPVNEHIGDALREAHPLFPKLAIRELIANALIHQDMTITGTGPQIELFDDRIEITNPGKPLVRTERMIDLPPRSRNEALASLMRRMGLCEEQGSGLDKVIIQVELYQLPPPLFRECDDATQAILYGPRTFAQMTAEERTRACYQHAVLKFLSGERMKNSTLSVRFGIKEGNTAQTSKVLAQAQEQGVIKPADRAYPRAGYVPFWA
jgi:ATP-dependent DNA helicase RecG